MKIKNLIEILLRFEDKQPDENTELDRHEIQN